MAAEFFRSWNEDALVETRRMVARFKPAAELRDAFTAYVVSDASEAYVLCRDLDYFEQLAALESQDRFDLRLIKPLPRYTLIDRWELWRPATAKRTGRARTRCSRAWSKSGAQAEQGHRCHGKLSRSALHALKCAGTYRRRRNARSWTAPVTEIDSPSVARRRSRPGRRCRAAGPMRRTVAACSLLSCKVHVIGRTLMGWNHGSSTQRSRAALSGSIRIKCSGASSWRCVEVGVTDSMVPPGRTTRPSWGRCAEQTH